jgi:polyisoprenoid-binding protein YceI
MACLGTIALQVPAQQYYDTDMQRSKMMVYGTSNLHDWDMKVKNFTCTLALSRNSGSIRIGPVHFSAMPENMESGNNVMDKKTRNALRADTYREIDFQASSPETVAFDTDSFEGSLSGELFLAGRTKRITLPFSGEVLSDNKIRVSGSWKLRMSDYSIDPPTALLGTLKTGDKVTVSFDLVFQKETRTAFESLNQNP